MSLDPITLTLIFSIVPIVTILMIFFVFGRSTAGLKIALPTATATFLGFVFLTLAYLFLPDPMVIYSLYFSGEPTITVVTIFTIFGTVFLAIAIFVFGSHRVKS